MVVGFTTTYVISDYHHNNDELNRINFVTDFQQVGGFLQFPPPIKLIATI
jgi:hypothetical protein